MKIYSNFDGWQGQTEVDSTSVCLTTCVSGHSVVIEGNSFQDMLESMIEFIDINSNPMKCPMCVGGLSYVEDCMCDNRGWISELDFVIWEINNNFDAIDEIPF